MDISGNVTLAMAQGQAQIANRTPAATPDPAQTAARDSEAGFLTQVMEEMLKTVNMGTMDGGFAEDTWRSFLARAYADELASRGSTGIAESVERSIGAYRAAMAENGGRT